MVSTEKIGGRLKHFLPIWKSLTTDKFILDMIVGAKIDFVSAVYQNRPCQPIKCSAEDKIKIDNEVEKYLQLGIIEKTSHSKDEFVSQIFYRPKKSGGTRIILNLKPLNRNVQYEHFKMEHLNSALNLMTKDCYMASIDLADAYYSVNIHNSYRKYLRFIWNGYLYQFTCLPNGLTSAPRWFTKIMKPIFSRLRNQGLLSVYYLDDCWLSGRSADECKHNVNKTHELLEKAGFLINEKKSSLVPKQSIEFLGFNLNSITMTVNLPLDKRVKIKNLCKDLLSNNINSIRFVSKVIGTLISSLAAVNHGALYYKYLENDKIQALKRSCGNFDTNMTISFNAKLELNWWIENVDNISKPIEIPDYSYLLTTDASHIGWGAVYNDTSTGGQWSNDEISCHINELELKAIYFGLKSYFSQLTDCHIRIRSDNTTAVTYVNNYGGVKSMKCHALAKQIWNWALNRSIHLSAEHLPGSENILADKASRIFDANTEWSLASSVFNNINNEFGPCKIDLFASRLNAKLNLYVSWKPDPFAVFVDAFSRNWNMLGNFYAFPPFSLILSCLQKIASEKAKGILIVPFWTTQPWFPKLMRMLYQTPMILPKDILTLPFSNARPHSQNKTLILLACPVSGKCSETEEFRMNLPKSYVPPGGHPLSNNMKSIIESGYISVVQEKLIPCIIMNRW